MTPTGVDTAVRPNLDEVAPRSGHHTLLRRARDTGMALLALAGALCIVWVALSAVFGLSLITFATGSMAPTMPTGTLAVVREIPASELAVGDVATLQRGGEPLPVTHRVTSIETDPEDPTRRIVSMQGDANPIPDVFPYYVHTAKVVLWSLPNGAYVTRALSSPFVLALVTVGIGALVLWSFWPRRSAEPDTER